MTETMQMVWIVTGWQGGDEWIESVHATEEGADREAERLWKWRLSAKRPDYHLCKFGVEPWEVRP